MTDLSVVILIIFGLAVVYLVGRHVGRQSEQIENLEHRVDEMETAGARRHTHNTLHGIHDAQALVLHALLRSMDSLNVGNDLLREALRILGQTSQDPYAYQDGRSRRDEIIESAQARFKRQLDRIVDDLVDDVGSRAKDR